MKIVKFKGFMILSAEKLDIILVRVVHFETSLFYHCIQGEYFSRL